MGKYYIDFSSGRKFYNELPEKTYFACGFNGSAAGQAYLFTWDRGTCLLPIIETATNQAVIMPENAGKEIYKGKLKTA